MVVDGHGRRWDIVCGVVAAYGRIDPDKCERMLARIQHRGPDDTGVLEVDGA